MLMNIHKMVGLGFMLLMSQTLLFGEIEMEGSRTATSKTYLLDDGGFRTEIYPYEIHFLDEFGRYQVREDTSVTELFSGSPYRYLWDNDVWYNERSNVLVGRSDVTANVTLLGALISLSPKTEAVYRGYSTWDISGVGSVYLIDNWGLLINSLECESDLRFHFENENWTQTVYMKYGDILLSALDAEENFNTIGGAPIVASHDLTGNEDGNPVLAEPFDHSTNGNSGLDQYVRDLRLDGELNLDILFQASDETSNFTFDEDTTWYWDYSVEIDPQSLTIYWEYDTSTLYIANEWGNTNLYSTYLYFGGFSDPIPSGTNVPVYDGDHYSVRTDTQFVDWNGNVLQHHHWQPHDGDEISDYHLLHSFDYDEDEITADIAEFQKVYSIPITAAHPVDLEIKDHWYVDEYGFQGTNIWVDINGQYSVFLEQGDPTNPQSTAPYYRLRAQSDYDGSLSYTFSHWLVSPADGATFLTAENEMTPVVFHNSAAEITAHYEAITLTLRAEHSDGSNLNEYLEIRRDGDSAWTQVLSGEAIGIRRSAMYRERPTQQRYTHNGNLVQHHHWRINDAEDIASYSLERYFEMADQTEETAIFDAILPVAITTEHPVEIEIHDPWFAYLDTNDQWIQPDDFRPLSEQIDGNGNLQVFLEQGQINNPNSTDPIYRLRAQSGYDEGPSYSFSHWSVSPEDGATFLTAENEMTPVVFHTPNAEITAHYEPVNILTNAITPGALPDGYYFTGEVVINGDNFVPSGSFFGALPGTHIVIAENARLRIYGTFSSNGTQSDPIHYLGVIESGSYRVRIEDQASAHFRHCNFTDIVVSSSVNNGESPFAGSICIFERCTFENDNNIALNIYGQNNRSVVRNCQFSNSQYGIISWGWAEPEITGCTFTGNDIGIVSTSYSEPLIRGCSFNGNTSGTGISASYSAHPKLWKVEENAWLCSANNNVFRQCNPAVFASDEAYPKLGFNLNIKNVPEVDGIPEGYGRTGWNRFYDNNVTDIVNDNQFAIYAIGNNWYPPHPLGLVSCSESEADTVGAVVWEPTVYGLVGNNVITDPPEEPDAVALPPGRLAEGEGNIELALELYDEMVNDKQSVAAVYGVVRCLWQQDDVGGIIDKMDEYSQAYPDSPIEEHSLSVLASYKLYLSGNVNLNEALEHIDDIKLNYSTTELDPKLLFEEAQVHEKLQGSAKMIAGAERERLPVKAKVAYTTLAEKYPDTPLGVLAAIMVGKQAKETTETIPSAYALYPAYPNPFNPTTTIRYGLPENSDVTLIVYDITGREIIQLVDSRVPAGDRRVIWNGRDRQGNPVASGLYIYRLVAKSNETKQVFTQSNKMVLMK